MVFLNISYTGNYERWFLIKAVLLIFLVCLIPWPATAYDVYFGTSGAPSGHPLTLGWSYGGSGGGIALTTPGPSPGYLDVGDGEQVSYYGYPSSMQDYSSGNFYVLQSYNHNSPVEVHSDITVLAYYIPAPCAKLVFASSGLPAGITFQVTGTKTDPGGYTAPFYNTVTNNGPGPDEKTKPGTQISYSFPATLVSGGVTYKLARTSPASPMTTGTDGSVIPVVGHYTRVTTTGVTSHLNPSEFGQPVTFTATVSGSGGKPDENVTFMDNGETWPGSENVTLNSTGAATIGTSDLIVGSHNISAWYWGNASMGASSGYLNPQLVNKRSTVVRLKSSPNPSGNGQAITFIATVSGSVGTDGENVTFMDNGETWPGSENVTINPDGSATVVTHDLSVGSHNITARYWGNTTMAAGMDFIASQVVRSMTTTTLISSKDAAYYGDVVSFTVLVQGSAGTVSENVMFLDNGNLWPGSSGVQLNSTGGVSISRADLTVGPHNISVWYSGNTSTAESMDSIDPLVIFALDTTPITVITSQNPSSEGSPVTFTAHIVGRSAEGPVSTVGAGPVPLNSVQFRDNGVNIGSPVVLDTSGNASYTITDLIPGNHVITAHYGGNTTWQPGMGTLSGGQTVNPSPPIVSFTGSPMSGPVPLTVRFNDTSTGTEITTYNWILGDNDTIYTTKNLTHTFANPGSYNISHSATNSAGTTWKNETGYITVGNGGRIGVYRPSNHQFYLDYNGNGLWNGAGIDRQKKFGLTGDVPVSGDWNNDGITETGVFRNSTHIFYLDYDGNGIWNGPGTDRQYSFGLTGDTPVSGDWNHDGIADIGVFRNSSHTFYLDYDGNGIWDGPVTDLQCIFGLTGDIPLSGDWNNNGISEIGVFRNSTHSFYLDYNGNGKWNGAVDDRQYTFGLAEDDPVSGDWDGNRRTDIGVFRNSTHSFYLDYNGNGIWNGAVDDRLYNFGVPEDIPVSGNWYGEIL